MCKPNAFQDECLPTTTSSSQYDQKTTDDMEYLAADFILVFEFNIDKIYQLPLITKIKIKVNVDPNTEISDLSW
jgi:hypothetical protein